MAAVVVGVLSYRLLWDRLSVDDEAWWGWKYWLVMLVVAGALGYALGVHGVLIGLVLAASHYGMGLWELEDDPWFGLAVVVGLFVTLAAAVLWCVAAWLGVQFRLQSLEDRQSYFD
jgi:hypothetical protein